MPAILPNTTSYLNDSQTIQKIGTQSLRKNKVLCSIYRPWTYGDNYDTSSASNTKLKFRKITPNHVEHHLIVDSMISKGVKTPITKPLFDLPDELFEIVHAIEDSKKILDLPVDWDSEGALAVPKLIWERAINVLLIYSKWIWENKGIILTTPSIDAIADGSIDIMWNSPKARLLLNIKNNPTSSEAHYYGDTYGGKNKFKGVLGELNEVQEFFAYWLIDFIK